MSDNTTHIACAPHIIPDWGKTHPTALLVLADGTVIEGQGLGATGTVEAEICFNTALTGYQEILTDPSYRGQIVTFTFPHIGNVGTNEEDVEDLTPSHHVGAVGAVLRAYPTAPSNYRAAQRLDDWLAGRGIIALAGVDTRALTKRIREQGALNGVITHHPDGIFDITDLKKRAAHWSGLIGSDLAGKSTVEQTTTWTQTPWVWQQGYGETTTPDYHIVAVDYGVKRNILRLIAQKGAKITVVPATTTAQEILNLQPDGVFLSNGPGDPAATAHYAAPMIRDLINAGVPIFGICLGHQLLALSLGAKTVKMHQGHHGANHPVKDSTSGKVEIVSMNHGFAVDKETLPMDVEETHISLFDGSNCGIRLVGKPVFSVQHHPEAAPGPQDSHYLFERFFQMIKAHRQAV